MEMCASCPVRETGGCPRCAPLHNSRSRSIWYSTRKGIQEYRALDMFGRIGKRIKPLTNY